MKLSVNSHWAAYGALVLGAVDVAYINVRLVPATLAAHSGASAHVAPPAEVAKTPPTAAVAPKTEAPETAPAAATEPALAAREVGADRVEPAREVEVGGVEPARPRERTWVVYFRFDEAAVEARAAVTLDAVASAMAKDTSRRLFIEGFADHQGPTPYNIDLSRRRAEAVAARLQKLGVSKKRIEIQGRGEAGPKRDDSASERSGRRVELRMSEAER